VVTAEEWDERRSGFLQEVQDRPHLTVIDSSTGEMDNQ
jgi:hypothetical protein